MLQYVFVGYATGSPTVSCLHPNCVQQFDANLSQNDLDAQILAHLQVHLDCRATSIKPQWRCMQGACAHVAKVPSKQSLTVHGGKSCTGRSVSAGQPVGGTEIAVANAGHHDEPLRKKRRLGDAGKIPLEDFTRDAVGDNSAFIRWLENLRADDDDLGNLIPSLSAIIDHDEPTVSQEIVDDVAAIMYERAGLLNERSAVTAVKSKRNRIRRPRGKTEVADTRSKREKAMYRKYQRMFAKDRRALWSCVKAGSGPATKAVTPSVEQFEEAWRNIFETTSVVDEEPAEVIADVSDVWQPVSEDDIKAYMRLPHGSATGPDRVKRKHLKLIGARRLSILLNVIMCTATLPSSMQENRTVFIPKKAAPKSPLDYRPITLASAVLRLLNGVLNMRLANVNPLSPRQRGFIRADGTFECVNLAAALIRAARQQKTNCYLLFLDVSKAFDSVSHDSLLRAMGILGAHRGMITYLRRLYCSASTRLQIDGIEGTPIYPQQGVKQGDPLSGTAFNCVTDEAIRKIAQENGVQITKDESVAVLAYADDLLIISPSLRALKASSKVIRKEYPKRGLTTNAQKTEFLAIEDGELADVTLTMDGKQIRSVDKLTEIRYLGGFLNYQGLADVWTQSKPLTRLLGNLKRAALKPTQKVTMLRRHLVPTILHGCVMSRCSLGHLRALDLLIRKWVKTVLSLPRSTPTPFLHLPIKMGGLGIPSLRFMVPCTARRRLLRMKTSSSAAMVSWTTTEDYEVLLADLERMLTVDVPGFERAEAEPQKLFEKSADVHTYFLRKMQQLATGRKFGEFGRLPASNAWLEGCRVTLPVKAGLRESYTLKAIKLRAEVLACPGGARRGQSLNGAAFCKCGRGQVAHLGHILQMCPLAKDQRVARHDKTLGLLVDFLELKFPGRVFKEQRLAMPGRMAIPDIIIRLPDELCIIDLAICKEGTPWYMGKCHHHKQAKYDRLWVLEAARKALGAEEGVKTWVAGCIFGAAGAVPRRTIDLLTRLTLSKTQIAELSRKALAGSISVYNYWNGFDTVSTRST